MVCTQTPHASTAISGAFHQDDVSGMQEGTAVPNNAVFGSLVDRWAWPFPIERRCEKNSWLFMWQSSFQKHQIEFLVFVRTPARRMPSTQSEPRTSLLLKKLSKLVALLRAYLKAEPEPGSASKLPVPHG